MSNMQKIDIEKRNYEFFVNYNLIIDFNEYSCYVQKRYNVMNVWQQQII